MADKVAVADSNPLAGIASLLQTLGGTKQSSSSSPGDVTALQSVLQQLQAQQAGGYEQLLQSIFQQASGQIPRMQAAMGNAVGARSGGNSAVQAALSELLKQTTLAGQQQIASQQAQNLQTQTQAAQAIAQATKGTMTTAKSGTNMNQAAAMLAGLQLFGKMRGMFTEDGSGDSPLAKLLGTSSRSPVSAAYANTPAVMPAGQMNSGAMGALDSNPLAALTAPDQGMAPMDWTGGTQLPADMPNFSDYFASLANDMSTATGADPLDALMNVTNGFGTMADSGTGLMDDLSSYGVF